MPETLALNFDLPSYFYLLREVCGVFLSEREREREFCELNSGKIQGDLQVIKMQSVEGKNSMRFLQLWHCEL